MPTNLLLYVNCSMVSRVVLCVCYRSSIQSVSDAATKYIYYIILSLILVTVLSRHCLLVGWLHCIICSLVSLAWHKQHLPVSWYEIDFNTIAVGSSIPLQHFEVRTSLQIFWMEMERHFHVMISMVESCHLNFDCNLEMYQDSVYALCNWCLQWFVIEIPLIDNVA